MTSYLSIDVLKFKNNRWIDGLKISSYFTCTNVHWRTQAVAQDISNYIVQRVPAQRLELGPITAGRRILGVCLGALKLCLKLDTILN